MNTVWTHEEAKNSFDNLINNALNHQQQIIQLENQQKIVVISFEDYEKHNKKTLGNWLIENMQGTGELDLPDRKDPEREIPFQS